MSKESGKPARNDLVVSSLVVRAPGSCSLVLNTDSSGKPALYLMDKSSNALSIAIDRSGRCNVTVNKYGSADRSRAGAGLSVDVLGGGMGVNSHQGPQIKYVALDEDGMAAHSSIGEPDAEGIQQGVIRHGLMTESS